MQQRQLIYRKFIIANLRRMGRVDNGAFRESVELIESRLRNGPFNAHFPDVEAELAILAHEESLFQADPDGYLASVSIEAPAPGPTAQETKAQETTAQRPSASEPSASTATVNSAEKPAGDAPSAGPTYAAPAMHQAVPPPAFGLKGLLAAAGVSVAAVWMLGFLFGFGGRCGLLMSPCYDSGWVATTNSAKSVTFNHNLGDLPENLQIYFSPDQAGSPAYPIENRWDQQTGNPVSIRVDRNNVYLEMWSGTPLRSVYNSETSQWTRYNSGFIRVLARR